ncbi:hypothetical protein [Siphonobacter sp. SORGH_AS_1065]|uniref:hypothetical protein n=1 Tax=Siphonobacter sp. SORGH_AS_1065 TaxID=3041795 RepID=UPI00277F921D|nr:hypothetical protein [Siphonobacter sp. SORGH_AS_1065]MDQ1088158.1 hypothetical protein [Siphonobacter sp. SORGH_AS_1065]
MPAFLALAAATHVAAASFFAGSNKPWSKKIAYQQKKSWPGHDGRATLATVIITLTTNRVLHQ